MTLALEEVPGTLRMDGRRISGWPSPGLAGDDVLDNGPDPEAPSCCTWACARISGDRYPGVTLMTAISAVSMRVRLPFLLATGD